MLIVVPSRRVAARIADAALAPPTKGLASRVAWTGDVVTLADLVDRALATDDVPRKRLGRVAAALLAAEVLRDLETEALRLFGPGVDGAGAARAIAAAIGEIRAAGLRAIDLVPAASGSRRVAALAAVVDAWERRLEGGGLLDEAGAVTRATGLVRAGAWPTEPLGELEVRGLYDVTRVQGELLLALARRASRIRVHVPFDPQDPSTTRYAYPYVHLWESLEDPGLDVEPVFLDSTEKGPEVRFRPATGPADEARRVAADVRRWIDDGVAPEEIAIVVPGPHHRVDGIARELSRRGVVHHARRGAPLLESPAVAAALLPFALLDEGLPRARIEAWVASPLTSELDPELLLPAVARGPVSGGSREEWNQALSAAQGEPAARLVGALAALDELGRAETPPAGFWSRYGDVLARVGLLDGMAERDPPGLAAWEAALLELRGAHEALGSWSAPARGWRTQRRSVLEALGSGRGALGRSGRGVEIVTARDARGLGFRRQALVGLVQGALSRPGPAAAVLGDFERRALNDALGRRAFRTTAEEALESDLLLVERIRATAEIAVLSWPVEDENAAPLLPGLEVERERERRGAPAPAAPVVADPPAWRAGRAAAEVAGLQRIELGRTSFFAGDPARRRAGADRWSGAFDAAALAALREEFAGGAMAGWSASALESWSQCAHQWFQRYLLRLRPPDERPLEAEARTTGDLAHLALRRLVSEGGPWDLPRVDAAVDAVAGEVRDHRRGAPAVWALTRRRVAAALHRYLEEAGNDPAAAGLEPVTFEASFGLEGSAIPAVPIETRHGPVALRGTIDRLDSDPEGDRLHVIDYKYAIKRKDHEEAVDEGLCGVERFQLHAYFLGALAWAESEGRPAPGTVTGAIHCLRSPAFLGPLTMPDPASVRAGIARAIETAAEAAFDPTPRNPKGCRYCDFRRGCRIATVPGATPETDEADE